MTIFVLTIVRTFQSDVRSRFPRLFKHDGSVYFAVMIIANTINLVLFIKLPTPFFAQSSGANSILSHIVSSTMLSRLTLSLHAASDTRSQYVSTLPSIQISTHFSVKSNFSNTAQKSIAVNNNVGPITRDVEESNLRSGPRVEQSGPGASIKWDATAEQRI
ncbi:hypothetical protein EW145_g2133 [Phellinidium pouzarii]|uniref:Uncharacterized protein n=1 Tax=Phellinidium pouzarii TaxID=167371 RepID=A0A4S4LC19_9AGAM|nr:hypothetical protein EW145_g2133 [Phellinidium pouzarii]